MDYIIEAKQVEGFASKLEWHFNNFLQEHKIKFIYEYKTFKTKKGMYTPDFYLYECNSFVEIKPFLPKEKDTYWKLFEAFVKENKVTLFIITPEEDAALSFQRLYEEKGRVYFDMPPTKEKGYDEFFKIKSQEMLKWPLYNGGDTSFNQETYTVCFCPNCKITWMEPSNVWLKCPKCEFSEKPYRYESKRVASSFKEYWITLDQKRKDRRWGY